MGARMFVAEKDGKRYEIELPDERCPDLYDVLEDGAIIGWCRRLEDAQALVAAAATEHQVKHNLQGE